MTRFYGLRFEELEAMPKAARRIYEDALPSLVAEEQLLAIEAASFPHMSESSRKAVQRSYADELPKAPPQAPRTDKLIDIGISFVDERKKP